ncbi:MAG TPA: hypothetical protein VNU24_00225 [Solirubrobacteraceae bacterium]|jgi:hypothetical protein|nr:hypothetical protein [Solirubrobacteraceae bacterium]
MTTESLGHADPADQLQQEALAGPTVTDPDEREREGPAPAGNRARVRLLDGPLAAPVLGRVVSMMLARADWPLDRLDAAMLMCDALSAHAFAHAGGASVTFNIDAGEHEAELRVLGLTDNGANGLVKDAMLPVVGNVIERIAERVSVEPGMHGEGPELVLALRARY